jgi:type II secretory pathway component PulK
MRLSKDNNRGSVVLVAFCLVAVIGIALASYINACYQSLASSTSEFHNRKARYLAEVGIEEALWALNNATWTSSGPASTLSWTGTTTKTLAISGYDLGSGSTGSLALRITNATGNNPGISSVATITLSSGKTYIKTLTANTNATDVQRAPLFGNAIAAVNQVRFQNVTTNPTVDSYNSASGAWNAATNKSYAAIVAA